MMNPHTLITDESWNSVISGPFSIKLLKIEGIESNLKDLFLLRKLKMSPLENLSISDKERIMKDI